MEEKKIEAGDIEQSEKKESWSTSDEACNIGYEMHTAAMRLCKPGIKEQYIAGASLLPSIRIIPFCTLFLSA